MSESVDLPPPVVTITDPAAPGDDGDVIGAEPRQLSPRRRRELGALAVVLLLLGLGVWAVRRVEEQHRLDRASVRELSIGITAGGSDPATLSLLSAGPHPVTVLSLGLDLPHLPAVRTTRTTLVRGGPAVVPFALPASCPREVRGTPQDVLVRVRTYRGQVRTLRLPVALADRFTSDAVYAMLAACGGYAPDDSFVLGPRHVRRSPEGLVVDVTVRNRSSVSRQLVYDALTGGLGSFDAVTTFVPLAPGASAHLSVPLSVQSCDEALATWQPASNDGFRAAVSGSSGGGVVLVPYADPAVDAWVSSQCGAGS